MLTVWVTTGCNLRCKYCYEGVEKVSETMTISTLDALIEWIKSWMKDNELSHEQIRIHGGEPTLEMSKVRYLINNLNKLDYQFDYGMTTNGYYILENDLDYLVNHVKDLWVSVDGCQESNDLNRVLINGEGTYDLVYNNLMYIRSKRCDVGVRMTITSETVHKLYDNIMFFINKGIKNIIAALDIWDDEWDKHALDILEVECKLVNDKLNENKNENVEVGLPIDGEIKKRECSGGGTGINIAPDGKFYPCSYTINVNELCCGDVHYGIDKEKIQCFEKINSEKIEECVGCTNYDCCMSVRCKFVNKKRMGDYFTPIPILCALQHKNMKLYNT